MSPNLKPVVKNYCGYPVDVVEVLEGFFDPQRGHMIRARVRYADGFIARALLRHTEISYEQA